METDRVSFKFAKKNMNHNYYKLIPNKFGAELFDINLNLEFRAEVIEQIKKDVTKHKLLIFRDQGIVSAERQVEIGKWFGELESSRYSHEKCPHPDVFRISNDPMEGLTGVGTSGWHIDGVLYSNPHSYSLLHVISAAQCGSTLYIPLMEVVENLPEKRRNQWNRISMISTTDSVIHPLLYKHPVTKMPVMCFSVRRTKGIIWDYGTCMQKLGTLTEYEKLLEEVNYEIEQRNGSLIYQHMWKPGDFIIADNRAVAHKASAETQFRKEKIGLRVLHRVTVKGMKIEK